MEVEKLFLFPFKSLKGVEINECEIDEHGFLYDRLYMLASQGTNGQWSGITQREEPAMARIETELKGDKLVLKYDGANAELPLDVAEFDNSDAPLVETELWGYHMRCKNIIASVAGLQKFFAKFFLSTSSNLAQKLTEDVVDGVIPSLAVLVSDKRRVVPQSQLPKEITTSFQDIWPATLMTNSSYDDLVQHVEYTDENAQIALDSFRMNILANTDEPYIEDDWKKIKIGDEEWIVAEPLERCSMPAVDQDTGTIRKGKHPLPSLNKYRVLQKGRPPCFGVNMYPTRSGFKVKVGDQISVLEEE